MEQGSKRWIVIAVLVGGFFGLNFLVSYYTDWLWFRNLDFQAVFWRMLRARFTSGALFGILAALIVGPNLWVAGRFTRQALRLGGSPWEEGEVPGEVFLRSRATYAVVGVVLVFILSNIGASQWPVFLRFFHAQSFGVSDPIFNNDVGFYIFQLPFYGFVAGFLIGALVVSAVVVGLIYAAAGGIRFQPQVEVMPRPLAHMSVIGGAFLLVMAWNYRLKIYELLYSQGRISFGAGYVDVNVQIWAYWVLVLGFLAAAIYLFLTLRSDMSRLRVAGIAVLVGGTIVVGSVPAALVQKLVVEPSELTKEAPYIEYNLEATTRAYGLDRIEEQKFEASDNLTRADIDANPLTIRNIRVWDERPMKQVYQQVQEIRPYYVFHHVDVDRYTVDGVYRQVMLSARELDTNRLPLQARNWVNERLQYTHGYGITMSQVNRITPEGLPALMIKDIPPISSPGLEVDRPEIYYGERTYAHVVVKTGIEEFDYPKGDENQFTTYQGTGGVAMGGWFNRLAFSARFMDVNLLLSGYIRPDSRIMFRRQVRERVQTVAPFLVYDSDPYMVLSEGKLYWIQDAYTASDMYPYSTRWRNVNYIRNSVKVVIDAYNGKVTFYQADKEDPIIRAYMEIFPGLFRPLSSMPKGLRSHLRYPIDLFRIQAARYRDYHMQDVQVFYNQEDLWEIPNEMYSGRSQMMEPYYLITKLPGEQKEEFLLMVPYTPAKKDNMIAWLAARCDEENYGHLLVYKLPKDKLIFGPMQIEARVDQQPDIASQLTLWGQVGSEVIRGNLLAIPIESSFLYVEPIYLQARQEQEQQQFAQQGEGMQAEGRRGPQPSRQQERSTAIPELKQVIVAFGGQVLMRDTLEDALTALFGPKPGEQPVVQRESQRKAFEPALRGKVQSAAELAAEAESRYERVRFALQGWDWARAGEEMKALERVIGELKKTLEEK
ncbi:MAG: UPF0182 family protein [bacterium]|nr:UPF0182 family protein [bacterium]